MRWGSGVGGEREGRHNYIRLNEGGESQSALSWEWPPFPGSPIQQSSWTGDGLETKVHILVEFPGLTYILIVCNIDTFKQSRFKIGLGRKSQKNRVKIHPIKNSWTKCKHYLLN